ncbi:MAG: DUF192 domain-containing protein [Deltaproteobacteria bacterium]|nr:DUF192 domain-containing protein [Deltaproteobacteria bacterium]
MIPEKSRNNGKFYTVTTTENNRICSNVKLASSFRSRLKGLMFTKSIDKDEGLYITPCTSIHMFFMKFSIDAVFLDSNGVILEIYHDLKPWRLSRLHVAAHGVLELHKGVAREYGLEKNTKLEFYQN